MNVHFEKTTSYKLIEHQQISVLILVRMVCRASVLGDLEFSFSLLVVEFKKKRLWEDSKIPQLYDNNKNNNDSNNKTTEVRVGCWNPLSSFKKYRWLYFQTHWKFTVRNLMLGELVCCFF